MTETQDFEHLLRKPNVIGVEWDDVHNEVVAFVSVKLPESKLPEDAIVANALGDGHASDVIETGEIRALDDRHRQRYRPVQSGISEGPIEKLSAGTGGPLARVRTPHAELWADSVSADDVVRLSNCHVYAYSRGEGGQFGDVLSQPARIDGGTRQTTVGELVGYVPLSAGAELYTDVAARSVSDAELDVNGSFGIADGETYPTSIRREFGGFIGQRVTKSGRTTGVTSAEVVATSASIRVRFDEEKVELFRDQVVAQDMSLPGDSGSPVYDSAGALTGLLFAGGDTVTVCNKVSRIEDVFGVDMLTAEDTAPEPEPVPIPEPEPPAEHVLEISARAGAGSVSYSFDVSAGTEVRFKGKSSTVVGDRVNGWVARWTNRYHIEGDIVGVSFSAELEVRLDGEPVDPSAVVTANSPDTPAPSDS